MSNSHSQIPLSYLSSLSGIGGKLKTVPEDFRVEEIAIDSTVLELDTSIVHADARTEIGGGKYLHFILQKKNWSTSSALSEIASRLHISPTRFNTAGIKDKNAITTQLASVSGVTKEQLASLRIKDIQINGCWTAANRIGMGDLLGNRFTITVRDCGADAGNRTDAIAASLNSTFPNYFGEQRFGSTRNNTHLIGQNLLQNKLEDAVFMFLCDSEGEQNSEAKLARKELVETRNFKTALKTYPKHLRLERSMIAQLEKNQNNYLLALRSLPRNILLLFVHAFQSYLFNQLLSERVGELDRSGSEPVGGLNENGKHELNCGLELEEGEYFCGEKLGFPDIEKTEAEGWIVGKIIGYQTMLNERERNLLEKLEISKEDFRVKAIPELGSKGTYRTLLSPLKDFSHSSLSETSHQFRFSLQSGSYATVAMREFMDKK